MAFVHGKSGVFKLDNSGGALQDLSTYCDSINMPRMVETGETTTFGVTGSAKTYVVGLNDATLSVGGKWDATLDAHMENLRAAQAAGTNVSATFEVGPEGSTTGKIKYTGECLLTSYEVDTPVGDVDTWTASFQVTGVITRTTY